MREDKNSFHHFVVPLPQGGRLITSPSARRVEALRYTNLPYIQCFRTFWCFLSRRRRGYLSLHLRGRGTAGGGRSHSSSNKQRTDKSEFELHPDERKFVSISAQLNIVNAGGRRLIAARDIIACAGSALPRLLTAKNSAYRNGTQSFLYIELENYFWLVVVRRVTSW